MCVVVVVGGGGYCVVCWGGVHICVYYIYACMLVYIFLSTDLFLFLLEGISGQD